MHRIRREIGGILALKLVGLAALYFAFFAHAPETSPHTVASHLLSD